jgi:hypothetical protein
MDSASLLNSVSFTDALCALVRSDAVEKELPQARFEKMMRKHLLLNR